MQFTTKSARVFGSDRADTPVMAMVVDQKSETAAYIPKLDPYHHFESDRLSITMTFLTSAWEEGATEGLQLIGPTGAGKTSLIEQMCARLDVPLISYTGHDRLEVPELLFNREAAGGTTLTVDGLLTFAMRHGCVFVLNEIDLIEPGTLTGLNDILERGFVVIPTTGEVVRAAPGFAFVATSNTAGGGDEGGLYVGTRVLNLAFRDRFMKVMVDYLPKPVETDLLVRRFPDIERSILESYVDVANMVREAFRQGAGMDVTMSTRTLIRWVRLTSQFSGVVARNQTPAHYALDLALAAGTSDAISHSLHQMVQQVMGVERYPLTGV